MKSSEGSVNNHSRRRAPRSPEVGALKIPAVKGSRALMSKGLEEVTVKTLNHSVAHRAYRPKRRHLNSQDCQSGVNGYFRRYLSRINARRVLGRNLCSIQHTEIFYMPEKLFY